MGKTMTSKNGNTITKFQKTELQKHLDKLSVNKLHRFKGQKVFLSFSGGRTSAYQVERLLSEGFHLENDVVIMFANTSWEDLKTIEFVHNCEKRWKTLYGISVVWVEAVVHHSTRKSCTHKVVDYTTCSKNMEVFGEAIKKYGLPNNGYPWCTREYKENPIKSYLTKVKKWKKGEYYTILGMRSDENQRVFGQAVKNFGKTYNLPDELLYKYRSVFHRISSSKQLARCITNHNPKNKTEFDNVYQDITKRWFKNYLKSQGLCKIKSEDFNTYYKRTACIGDTQNKVYPLVDWFLDQPDKLCILDWWEDQEFDLDLPEHLGNCTGCYKKSTKKLLKVIRDRPNEFTNTLEIDYGYVGSNKINGELVDEPRTMYRQGATCQSLIALFKQTPPQYLQDDDEDEQSVGGCGSSCEAFGGD